MQLETLVLELLADDSRAERTVKSFVDRSARRLKSLEKGKISVGVEDEQLHDLNKLLDVKQAHLLETVKLFNAKPIVAKVDITSVKLARQELAGLKGELKGFSATVKAEVTHKFEGMSHSMGGVSSSIRSLSSDLRAIERAVKGPGLIQRTVTSAAALPFKVAANVATAPSRLIGGLVADSFRGIGERIGNVIADEFATSGVKKVSKGVKKVGRVVSQEVVGDDYVAETFLAELLRSGNVGKASTVAGRRTQAAKYATRLEALQKIVTIPAKNRNELIATFNQVAESDSELKAIRDRLLEEKRKQRVAAGETKYGKVQRNLDTLSILRDFIDEAQPKGIGDNIVRPLVSQIQPMLRFIEGMQAYNTSVLSDRFYRERKAGFPILDGQNVVSVIGGAQREFGQGSRKIAPTLEFLSPNTRFIPVENLETDATYKSKEVDNFISNIVGRFAPQLVQDQEAFSTVLNAGRQIAYAVNPMASSTAAAQALANTRLAQEQGARGSVISYSLGGADSSRYASVAKYAGIENSPALAMAYPYMNFLQNKSQKQFQSVIVQNDPLTFPYGLNVNFPTNQAKTVDSGMAVMGSEAHGPHHLFKSVEFLKVFFETLGEDIPALDPNDISSAQQGLARIMELLSAAEQVKSLVETGDFNLKTPYNQFGGSGSNVMAKLMESKSIVGKLKDNPIENVQQIANALDDYFAEIRKSLSDLFKSQGIEIPDMENNFEGFLKYAEEIKKINNALASFKSGKMTAPDDDAYFAGGLNPEIVAQRYGVLQNDTIKYFRNDATGKRYGIYQKMIVDAYEELARIAKAFIDTQGKLSDEAVKSISLFDEPNVDGKIKEIMDKQLKGSLPKEEEVRIEDWDVPEAFKRVQSAILAYNKLLKSLGGLMPSIKKFKSLAFGMSGAAALLTEDLVYKTDLDPDGASKIASPQEVAAYQKLQGRLAPLLYSAVPGQALVTERIKGRPLKEILDRIAKPIVELQAQRQELISSLEGETDDNVIAEKRAKIEQMTTQIGKDKARFNKAAKILYTQVGQLGGALQSMGVLHNDLASGNVFFAQGGATAIDLGNAKVINPKEKGASLDKIFDELTTDQRALIDKQFYGLLDPLMTVMAIRQGYSKPAAIPNARTINKDLLAPDQPGQAIPLGTTVSTLLQQKTGKLKENKTIADVVQLGNELARLTSEQLDSLVELVESQPKVLRLIKESANNAQEMRQVADPWSQDDSLKLPGKGGDITKRNEGFAQSSSHLGAKKQVEYESFGIIDDIKGEIDGLIQARQSLETRISETFKDSFGEGDNQSSWKDLSLEDFEKNFKGLTSAFAELQKLSGEINGLMAVATKRVKDVEGYQTAIAEIEKLLDLAFNTKDKTILLSAKKQISQQIKTVRADSNLDGRVKQGLESTFKELAGKARQDTLDATADFQDLVTKPVETILFAVDKGKEQLAVAGEQLVESFVNPLLEAADKAVQIATKDAPNALIDFEAKAYRGAVAVAVDPVQALLNSGVLKSDAVKGLVELGKMLGRGGLNAGKQLYGAADTLESMALLGPAKHIIKPIAVAAGLPMLGSVIPEVAPAAHALQSIGSVGGGMLAHSAQAYLSQLSQIPVIGPQASALITQGTTALGGFITEVLAAGAAINTAYGGFRQLTTHSPLTKALEPSAEQPKMMQAAQKYTSKLIEKAKNIDAYLQTLPENQRKLVAEYLPKAAEIERANQGDFIPSGVNIPGVNKISPDEYKKLDPRIQSAIEGDLLSQYKAAQKVLFEFMAKMRGAIDPADRMKGDIATLSSAFKAQIKRLEKQAQALGIDVSKHKLDPSAFKGVTLDANAVEMPDFGKMKRSAEQSGTDIGEGLNKGAEVKIPEFKAVMTELAESGQDAFDKTMGIQSPSRWAIERMNFIALGLMAGAVNNLPKIKDMGEMTAQEYAKAVERSIPPNLPVPQFTPQIQQRLDRNKKKEFNPIPDPWGDESDSKKRIVLPDIPVTGFPMPLMNPDLIEKTNKTRNGTVEQKRKVPVTKEEEANQIFEEAMRRRREVEDKIRRVQFSDMDVNNLNERLKSSNGGSHQSSNSQNGDRLDQAMDFAHNTTLEIEDRVSPALKEIYSNAKATFPIIQDLENRFGSLLETIKRFGLIAVSGLGLALIGKGLYEVGKNALMAYKNLEGVYISAKLLKNGSQYIADLKRQSIELGSSLQSTLEQGIQFSSATMGTSLESQSAGLFASISKSLSYLGLSTQQYESALLALKQVASKGRVSLEEISGQLGEALPGALPMIAKALGTNVPGAIQQIESGNVLAEDLLPKFAGELQKRTSALAPAYQKSLTASTGRVGTLTETINADIGERLAPAVIPIINKFADVLMVLSNNLDVVAGAVKNVAIALSANMLVALAPTIKGLFSASGGLVSTANAAKLAQAAFNGLKAALGPLTVALAAITAFDVLTFTFAHKGSDEVLDAIESVDQALKSLKPEEKRNINVEVKVTKTGSWLLDTIGNALTGNLFGKAAFEKEIEGASEFTNKMAAVNDAVAKFGDPQQMMGFVNQLNDIDSQISTLQGNMQALRMADPRKNSDQIDALAKQIETLTKQRAELDTAFGSTEGIDNTVKAAESLKAYYEAQAKALENTGDTEKANRLKVTIAALNTEITMGKRAISAYDSAMKLLGTGADNQRRSFIALTEAIARSNQTLERGLSLQRAEMVNNQLNRGIQSQRDQFEELSFGVYEQNQRIKQLQDTLSKQQQFLNSKNIDLKTKTTITTALNGKPLDQVDAGDIAKLQEYLQTSGNTKGAAIESLVQTLQAIVETRDNLAKSQVGLADAKKQLAQFGQSYTDYKTDIARQLFDLNRQIEDQKIQDLRSVEDLQNQMYDANLQIQQANRQLREAYADMAMDFNTQVATIQKQIADGQDQLKLNQLRIQNIQLSPGNSNSWARQLDNILLGLKESGFNALQTRRQLELDELQLVRDRIQRARQIRDLEDQQRANIEAARRSMQSLTRAFQDLERSTALAAKNIADTARNLRKDVARSDARLLGEVDKRMQQYVPGLKPVGNPAPKLGGAITSGTVKATPQRQSAPQRQNKPQAIAPTQKTQPKPTQTRQPPTTRPISNRPSAIEPTTRKMLVQLVAAEAGNQTLGQKTSVAITVLNRHALLNSGIAPTGTAGYGAADRSLLSVIMGRGANGRAQYSPVDDGRIYQNFPAKVIKDAEQAVANAEAIMLQGNMTLAQQLGIPSTALNATNFRVHTLGAERSVWKGKHVKYGSHIFGTDKFSVNKNLPEINRKLNQRRNGKLISQLNFNIPESIELGKTAGAMDSFAGMFDGMDQSSVMDSLRQGAVRARELSPDNWFWGVIDAGENTLNQLMGKPPVTDHLSNWQKITGRPTKQTPVAPTPAPAPSFAGTPPVYNPDNYTPFKLPNFTTPSMQGNLSPVLPVQQVPNVGSLGTPQLPAVETVDTAPLKQASEDIYGLSQAYQQVKAAIANSEQQLKAYNALDQLAQFFYQIEDSNRQSKQSLRDQGRTINSIVANSKGWLTINEAVLLAGQDTASQFDSQLDTIQQQRREIQRTLTSSDALAGIYDQIVNELQAQGVSLADAQSMGDRILKQRVNELASTEQQLAVNERNLQITRDTAIANAQMLTAMRERISMIDGYIGKVTELKSAQYDLGGTLFNDGAIIQAQMMLDTYRERATLEANSLHLEGQKRENFIELQKQIAETNLAKSYREAVPFINEIGAGLKDIVLQTTTWQDALSKILQTMASTVLDQLVIKPVSNMMGGLLGGLFGLGGLPTFANGVDDAFSRERALSGKQPQLAVIHKGEAVLSTLNGDAQLWRTLKARGEIERMKRGGLKTYAMGTPEPSAIIRPASQPVPRTVGGVSLNQQITVYAKDADSFRKSQDRITRENAASYRRVLRTP